MCFCPSFIFSHFVGKKSTIGFIYTTCLFSHFVVIHFFYFIVVMSRKRKGTSMSKKGTKRKRGLITSRVSTKVMSPEKKCFDFNYVIDANAYICPSIVNCSYVETMFNSAAGASGGFTQINQPVTGTDSFNRVGNKINIKSVQVRMSFAIGTGFELQFRTLLVLDGNPNGVAPVLTDILADSNIGMSFLSGTNVNNQNRFLILRDKCYSIDALSSRNLIISWYNKLDITQTFKGSVGTIADTVGSAIYLICFVDDLAHGFTPYFVSCRTRYFDV